VCVCVCVRACVHIIGIIVLRARAHTHTHKYAHYIIVYMFPRKHETARAICSEEEVCFLRRRLATGNLYGHTGDKINGRTRCMYILWRYRYMRVCVVFQQKG